MTLRTVFDSIWSKAWILLVFTAAVWGAHGVGARMAIGEMSPMTLVLLRWFFVCLILGVALHRQLRDNAHLLLHAWRRLLPMGFFGFTAFNAIYYYAAYYTSAINLTLLQSLMPPMILAGALVVYRVKVTPAQICGLIMALAGIVVIASHGELARLLALQFNIGDIGILIACVFYSGYTLSLRSRPPLPALVFFTGLAGAAFLEAIPLFMTEIVAGAFYWPSLKGWLILVFVVLGPSLSSQITYMRGIELIGPGRAGLFNSLVPVFGALFAVLLLGEPFAPYHAVALGLGMGGVYFAERKA